MWRWVALVVGIVGLSAAIPVVVSNLPSDTDQRGVAFPAAEVPSGPVGKLLIDGPASFNFGKKAVLSTGKEQVTIKNVGDGKLKIWRGEATCQCTVAEFDQALQGNNVKGEIWLEPGESTTLTLSWTAKNAGKFEQSASIRSSDPVQPEAWFKISGHAYPPLITMPEEPVYDLPGVSNEEESKMYLAISSFDQPNFKILEIQSSNPSVVSASHVPLDESERKELKFESGYKVEMVLHPSTEIGSFSETLVIKTDHPAQNELTVLVRGRRTGAISAVPEVVRFKADETRGGHNESLLLVRGHSDTTFEIEKKPAELDVRIEPIAGQEGDKVAKFKLITDVKPGTAANVIESEVVLKTTHPQVASLKIPVKILVLGSN